MPPSIETVRLAHPNYVVDEHELVSPILHFSSCFTPSKASLLQKDQPHLGGLQLLGHPPVVEVKLQVPVPDAKLQLPQRLVVVLRRAASSQRTQLRGARPRGAGARRRAAIALQP